MLSCLGVSLWSPTLGATLHPGRRAHRLRSRGVLTAAAEEKAPAAGRPRSGSAPTGGPRHHVARIGRTD